MTESNYKDELAYTDEKWNEVISILADNDFPASNKLIHETLLVFYYYSEMESGGHQNLLNWLESYQDQAQIDAYFHELTAILEAIGAQEYASLIEQYGLTMWAAYRSLQNEKIEEETYYGVIEEADLTYDSLDQKLEKYLERYFMKIHQSLTDLVDEK